MSKSKSDTKAIKASKDVLTKVKSGAVTKPAKTEKIKSKDVAKKVAEKEEKKSKKSKKAKEPTPEPDSDSDDSSDSDSDSESEVKAKKPVTNGAAKKAAAADSSDESEDSDSSEDEAPAKVNGASKAAAKKDESDSDSDESDSSEDEAPTTKAKPVANGATKAAAAADDDSDDSSDSDVEEEESKKPAKAEAEDADSSDDSDSSEEEEESKPNKRKADDSDEPVAKKAKTEEVDDSKKNLFVGNLSWNIDEAWLRSEFEEFGELSGVRLMTDRGTGRSKGFGYVEFVNAKDAAKAHATKNGADLDGRAMNVDFSNPRPDQGQKQDDRRKQFGDQLSEPTDTLFIGNIAFDVGQESVTEIFSPYGTILGVRLPTDRDTGAPKGFGYVNFSSVDEAKTALEGLQGYYLEGRPLRLDYSQPRQNTGDSPARGGRGGFGGRGGSGGFGGGRGGFGGRGGGRGGPRGGRGGSRGGTTNRGGFGDFAGKRQTFD